MKIFKFNIAVLIVVLFLFSAIFPAKCFTQDVPTSNYNPDPLVKAAREMISGIQYCVLITLDDKGNAQARTMDPFLPDSNMIVWFGTNMNSRKVKEIENNTNATVYYQAENGAGYVTLKGNAYVVVDPDLKQKYWKPQWKAFYPESKENYALIKFIPFHLEVVSYKHNIIGDTLTWAVPNIKLR